MVQRRLVYGNENGGEEAYLEFSLVNDKDQEIYFYMTSSGFADNNYLF